MAENQDIYVRKDVYEADQRTLLSEIRRMHDEQIRKITGLEHKIDLLETRINGKIEIVTMHVDSVERDLRNANHTLLINTLMTALVFGVCLAGIVIIRIISDCFKD